MKKKMNRIFVMLLVVITIMAALPATTFAKGAKGPYKDVTLRTVDKQSYKAIVYVKGYGGWRGLIKKGKFYPNRYITRREYLTVLHNLYGNRVTATIVDIVYANSKITSDFACKRLAAMSKGLGYTITWDGYQTKMKRKDVARYIYAFANFNKKLAPRK